ncbi:venom allergen 5-like [Rhipicephalus microplus]|uniref:venom allergen 5-like n=1 Tax=Rhipicephalus microplus TaxID=6941 RepID=UPI003F6BE5F2
MLFGPRVSVLFCSVMSLGFLGLSLQRCLPEYREIEGHTACLPRNYECDILSWGLTEDQRKSFIDVHNKYRSMVARGMVPPLPPASDMRKLRWDDGLAEVAEALAKQCRLQHDSGRHRLTVKFRHTGQNMAAYWKSNGDTNDSSSWVGNDIEKAVKSWFNEYRHYPPMAVTKFSENAVGPVGHFTQVVWANTEFVGCGAARFRKNNGRGGATNLYVCNYADAGNHAGKPVYQPGRRCSHCPHGAACELPAGLCVGGSLSVGLQTPHSWSETPPSAAVHPSSAQGIATWVQPYEMLPFGNGPWYDPYKIYPSATSAEIAWTRRTNAQWPELGRLAQTRVHSSQGNKRVTWKPSPERDVWERKWGPLGFWKTKRQSFNILRDWNDHIVNSPDDFPIWRFRVGGGHIYISRPEQVSVTVFGGYRR